MTSTRKVPFARRRNKKTNYIKRLALLKSGKNRLVFRRTNKSCIVQLIKYYPEGDRTVVHVNSKRLAKYGWLGKANMPTAYLCGYIAAKECLSKGINEAVFDIGLITPIRKSSCFAALKGALDGGLSVSHRKEVIPDEGTISGKHIESFASSKSPEERKKIFSEYFRKNIEPTKLNELFKKVKESIDKEFQKK
ncbi:MAG: 50S ribosomal protein L18 [Candidatus Diapherotrites archaeon]|nr:50S ribosomal protein L18 [Candidatus Diapherotrites archaeon]